MPAPPPPPSTLPPARPPGRPPAAPSASPTPAPPAASEPPPRFVAERQQRIAQALRHDGRVEVPALAAQFGVSEDTIRRDLRQLAARGLVQKTHGGAVAVHSAGMPTRARQGVLTAAKQAIAQAALALVQPHQTLFIDAGSTTLALACALRGHAASRPLTVITHALDVALALIDDPQIRLVLAGGEWQADDRVFSGEPAVVTVSAWRADIAFLGACALHARAGLTAIHPEEAAIKRAMVRGAARRIVLSDHSKLDQVAPCAVAAADEVDLVISDAAVPWLAGQLQIAAPGG